MKKFLYKISINEKVITLTQDEMKDMQLMLNQMFGNDEKLPYEIEHFKSNPLEVQLVLSSEKEEPETLMFNIPIKDLEHSVVVIEKKGDKLEMTYHDKMRSNGIFY